MDDQEKKNLHYKLLAEIGDYISHDTGDLQKFKAKLKSILKPADLAANKSTDDVFEAMEGRGKLDVGEYGKLKEAFRDFREDIIKIIEKTEKEMGIDLDYENQAPAADATGGDDTMDPKGNNKTQLHCNLISDINDRLCTDIGNLSRFKRRMRPYLNPNDLAPNKTFLNIAESLEQRGKLKIGHYDILIKALEGDQNDIIKIIKETEEKIKNETFDELEGEASTSGKSNKESMTSRKRKEPSENDRESITIYSRQSKVQKAAERKEPSENDRDSITIYSRQSKVQKAAVSSSNGENFRKVEETALDYEEIYNIIHQNVCNQIGNISIAKNTCVEESQGTGFRVGGRMVMSAYHVFKPRLEFTWKMILETICRNLGKGNELRSALAYFFEVSLPEQNHEVDFLNQWRRSDYPLKTFNDLIELFKKKRHSTLPGEIRKKLDELKEIGTIAFADFRKDGKSKVEYKLDLDTPFYSEEDDVILVNLIVDENNESRLPGPLRLDNKSPSLSSIMHILGHPDNKRLQFDPGCIVYTEKETLEKDINEAKEYCIPKCKDDFSKSRIEDEYDRALQLYKLGRRVIFHSSRSLMHGASGSPGIVMDGIEPKVQTMLQQGHPYSVYNSLKKEELEVLPARIYFESGLAIKRLEDLLSLDKLCHIKKDIFQSCHVSMEH
ncbi:hypothetical protein KUTeg_002648 [Tegillarca granosa]|uniref:DED domain-containing protein n=1 Tax=Tegillarca granosa TaxID=220873 RepID=A0ABQ9FWF2_TEGGR|nr:hypothetical protein KUTeg_002648 [Tegillarca granosa]